ncbi:MAG TPA: hypothetical protein P5186_15000 [Candidatus Paceibacterota bacterium]|nr:hypothetical protein [Candidatus Paceibacterota bacterium]HRZ99925.1 hypothetical protein [Candidatus Paceibacterota bacterium]
MKTRMNCWTRFTLVIALTGLTAWAQNTPVLVSHGLPSGPAQQVLPAGALLHLQVNNLFKTVTQVEQILRSLVPMKAAPPDLQGLLQQEHPLLTLLGMQIVQQPLTLEKCEEAFGLKAGDVASLTLYPGDPRRLWILSIPMARPQPLGEWMLRLTKAKSMEPVQVGEAKAMRLALEPSSPISELYVVCSENMAYVCGDRSLVLSLHGSPTSQRLAQDAFVQRAVARMTDFDLSLLFNPALMKTLILPVQQLQPLLGPVIQMQRKNLLDKIPAEARSRMEMQLRRDLGVKNLEELADYAEIILLATAEQLIDGLAQGIISFEGISGGIKLDAPFKQVSCFVYSRQIQPDKSTKPLPLAEVKRAMTWLGPGHGYFSATGQQPPAKAPTGFASWLDRVKKQLAAKGLESRFLVNLEQMVRQQVVVNPIESRTPWTLTASARLSPALAIKDFSSLEAYWHALVQKSAFPGAKPVVLLPARNFDLLASWCEEETQALNRNTQLEREFQENTFHNQSWLQKQSRFRQDNLEGGLRRFILENGYSTRSGLFGYDQHEFINRRSLVARQLDDYLIYHHGVGPATWLASFTPQKEARLAPAIERLLSRLPEGAQSFTIQRVLDQLPGWVNDLRDLEQLARADLDKYLQQAQELISTNMSETDAAKALGKLNMPPTLFSINRDAVSGQLYGLLPGFISYPRPPVVPVLQNLLSRFAARAPEVGGSLSYTRVQPELKEWTHIQSLEGLSCLITNLGNTLVEDYLSTPEKQRELQRTFVAEKDGQAGRFDEILVKNPQWEFLPTPPRKTPVRLKGAIPPRDPSADRCLIDLTPYYHSQLDRPWQEGGMANNSLAHLPKGLQEFGGVQFDVRGVIQLSGRAAQEQLRVQFPREVKDIKIGQKAGTLHVLHATAWPEKDGAVVGSFLVHYANGEQREIPIVYGRDVRDWWTQSNESESPELKVAWTGQNSATGDNRPPIRLFKTQWQNPLADTEIDRLDYRSAMSESAPFLIAITLE